MVNQTCACGRGHVDVCLPVTAQTDDTYCAVSAGRTVNLLIRYNLAFLSVELKAIEAFTQFMELYPESPYAEQAYKEMAELYDKLAYKELKSAQLYYNLGSYLGNNYLSCEIVAKNALKDYPSNAYQEDFNWLILQAKYQQMVNSFEERKMERARDTQDEYYNFITEYPNSKHRKDADRMLTQIKKITKE